MAFLRWFVVSMLLVPAFPAGAGLGCPAPGIGGGDVSRQQTPETSESPESTDEEEEEYEEPDCD